MRKKFILLTFLIASFCLFTFPKFTSAATFQSGIDDQAQLLGSDAQNLSQQAAQLSDQVKANIYVVTTNDSTSVDEYSKTYLDNRVGQNENAVVLVINMNLRKVYIRGRGNMSYYMDSSRINTALDVIQPKLTSQDYTGAVTDFFDKVSAAVKEGIPGRSYTVNPETGAITFHRSFQLRNIILALIIALIVPAIFAWMIRRRYQMKDASAHVRYNYSDNGSITLSQQQDILVNTFITTRHIERNQNSGGGGGSGDSGGGRSF